jgi:lipoic acid synthetase
MTLMFTLQQFEKYRVIATQMGFSQVASGPMVRSSYHADVREKNLVYFCNYS